MKRFHVHVAVDDIDANVRFYSAVFGMPPTVRKADYAKWMVEDPRINFAISARGARLGVDHLGMQVDSDDELRDLRAQVDGASVAAVDQPGAQCCYARSDKYWITDPQGLAWETYHTLEQAEIFGADTTPAPARASESAACCAPRPQSVAMPLPRAGKSSCC